MRIKLRRAAQPAREAIGTRADRRKVVSQYLLPKNRLTAFAGRVASKEGGRTPRSTIRWFVRKYAVDMSEAVEPDVSRYNSFNDFFTRALKPSARPLADAALISPVDGSISQFGKIEHDQILQAKGHRYSTTALVGGDQQLAQHFHDGSFATLYLSPRDYHRIHMPCGGRLLRMIHVPGDLFSVNPMTARGVPGLFARNERTVCVFERLREGHASSTQVDEPKSGDEARELFAVVLVGATIVGSMATVWHGVINAQRRSSRLQSVREWFYGDGTDSEPIVLKKGAEMGRFMLGSTVVLLFQNGPLAFNPDWEPGKAIRFGEAMADEAA
jgi:phosphatidylserine decarboxylase